MKGAIASWGTFTNCFARAKSNKKSAPCGAGLEGGLNLFKHGKYIFYSVREKINYYTKVLSGKIIAPKAKRKAKNRLKTLHRLNGLSYSEPQMIVTNDKHFGNSISKPRGCVVIDSDERGRLLVSPVEHRTTELLVLSKDLGRQFGSTGRKYMKQSILLV